MADKDQIEEMEDDKELPFANARVDRVLREGLDNRKMIRSEVRESVNEWLGKIALDMAKEMNKSDKVMISLSDFNRAITKWERADALEIEKERLLASLKKLELDVAALREEIDRRL